MRSRSIPHAARTDTDRRRREAQTQLRVTRPIRFRFSEAQPSSSGIESCDHNFAHLPRARWRALHSREIVAGSFQTIGGAISEINLEKQEIKINDLQSKQAVTVVVTKDSAMRKLSPELVDAITKGSSDLQEMFDRLPTFTIQELKAGDSILISSTKGADPTRVTAIAVVSGVGPLLKTHREVAPFLSGQ